jgi:hypothetical protein
MTLESGIEHPSLESSFGYLLAQALMEWCDIGRYAHRRLDDLLFNEYDPARDGDFHAWMQVAMYAEYQPGAEKNDEPCPPHRILVWPLLIIQGAIYSREPERIAQILAYEAEYEVERIAENDWVDMDGNPAPLDAEEIRDDQRAVTSWALKWRRTFGGKVRSLR